MVSVVSGNGNTDSKDQTIADCSLSLNSSSGTDSISLDKGSKSSKRSLCEDDETSKESTDQPSKKVRLDADDSQRADSTVSSMGEIEAQFSPPPPASPPSGGMDCQSTR